MTVVPISIYENGEYVAGADIDKVSNGTCDIDYVVSKVMNLSALYYNIAVKGRNSSLRRLTGEGL